MTLIFIIDTNKSLLQKKKNSILIPLNSIN